MDDPNSQPDPIMDVSDAHAAPISPSSRFRPVSAGVVVTAVLSVAMIDSPFLVSRSNPEGRATRPAGSRLERVSVAVQSEEHARDHPHI